MTYDAKKGRQNRAIAYAPSPPRSVCLRLIVTPRTNKKIREFQTKTDVWLETRAKGTFMEYALVVEQLNLYLQLVFILFLL